MRNQRKTSSKKPKRPVNNATAINKAMGRLSKIQASNAARKKKATKKMGRK